MEHAKHVGTASAALIGQSSFSCLTMAVLPVKTHSTTKSALVIMVRTTSTVTQITHRTVDQSAIILAEAFLTFRAKLQTAEITSFFLAFTTTTSMKFISTFLATNFAAFVAMRSTPYTIRKAVVAHGTRRFLQTRVANFNVFQIIDASNAKTSLAEKAQVNTTGIIHEKG